MGVLEHAALAQTQGILFDVLHVDAVTGDEAALNLIEAVNQVGDGGLARAGGAHKGNFLPGIGIDGHVLQHPLALHIGEIHMAQAHRAPQLGVAELLAGNIAHRAADEVQAHLAVRAGVFPGPAVARHLLQAQGSEGAVLLHAHPQPGLGVHPRWQQLEPALLLVRLAQLQQGVVLSNAHGHQRYPAAPGHLPGPVSGPAAAGEFGQGAVGVLLHGHQSNLSPVHLGLGIHHRKDALRPRHGGEQGGHLHGYLIHRLSDLPVIVEIRHQRAQGEAGVHTAAHSQDATQHRGDSKAHICQIAGNGHNGGGIEAGLAGGGAVLLVQSLELGFGLRLMGKRLDHLQPLNHLLNISVDGAQGGLLPGVVFPAALAKHGKHRRHRRQQSQRHQKQHGGQGNHHGDDPHEGDNAGQQLNHRLLQSHLHVVRVVGEAAHQLAVGVGVKVAQRQLLKLVKQLPAQPVAALHGQLGHEIGLKVGAHRGQRVHTDEL